ncbi:hypothetical protein Tmar_0783 [Thermaerobacter marianensis DSM 12885]|uniref:Rad50/SbcC-type AAA domain-containing protein n=1 Tax=Thermaerobacter marianensis (strain ATCC 700841 / DSM 12885 / JCM 10246 / 7p75a) TaxID=644966 RepID=E6SIJ2_THEM7|nr:AAA family ATPase [Thermaerobacter marianensis]ADU50898.1 hypothetical protein Tmar_0783 [Thermaerobacter marianensis DSM 12885]
MRDGEGVVGQPVTQAGTRDGRPVEAGAATDGGGTGPVAGGPRVTWHRLVLRGFGPFQGTVAFRFPEGLSHWVAPNETGKSTLVAGLVAVLFGLPGGNDPVRFGQARYRHWGGAPRFEGELEFTGTDGRAYRIERDFATHKVRLLRLDPQGPIQVWAGTHNPGSSRSTPGYEDAIRHLVGVGSRTLMLETFLLQQPVAVSEAGDRKPGLPAEVQQMVAGAGGRSPAQAAEFLTEAIKRLTRQTRDLGVSGSNQRHDRAIEQLDQKIQELEARIAREREAADNLELVRRQLAEITKGRSEADRQLRLARQRREAWVDWRRRVERYLDRARQRASMEQAAQRAQRLRLEMDRLDQEEEREWPGWAALAGENGEDPGAALQRLLELEQAAAARKEQREAARRKQRQATARSLLAVWFRYRFLAQAAGALDRLSERVPRLATATPEELERLRDAPRREAELARQVALLEGELRAREAALRDWQAEAEALDAAYAAVRHWTAETAAAAAELADLRERAERQQEEARRREEESRERRKAARRLAVMVALLAGVAVAAAGRILDLTPWLLPLVAGLSTFAAGWVAWRWAGGPAQTGPAGEDGDLRGRIQQLEARLGPLAGEPPSRLRDLERQFREWRALRDGLEQRRQQLDRQGPEEVRTRLDAARAQVQALRQWLEPFLAGARDAVRVAAWWEAVSRLRRRVEDERAQLAREVWGARPDAVPDLPAGDGEGWWWERARRLTGDAALADLGGPPDSRTVSEFAAWLESGEASVWEKPIEEAARWAELAQRAAEWCQALEGSWIPGDDPDPAAVPAWPPTFYDHLVHLQAASEREAAASAQDGEAAEAQLDTLQREQSALRERWRELLEPAGGDPARARERWQAFGAHRQRRRELEKQLEGVLTAWGVADADALAIRVQQAADAATVDLKAIHDLAERFPELPADDLEPARAVEALAQLDVEIEALETQLNRLEEELRELSRREAGYLQREPVNVAQAELELRALRAERQGLQDELDALVLAYRHLKEAQVEFQATYRQRLEEAASRYFARLTGRPGRRVALDDGFHITVREPDGTPVVLEQLSQGTRDQLVWALRVAVADLLAGDVNVPFVLDDPFAHWDDGRLEEGRQIVTALARDRQVIVLSHRPALRSWGEPVAIDGVAAAGSSAGGIAEAPPGGEAEAAAALAPGREEGERP